MTSNPYDFEKIPTVTSEMILFARAVLWYGVSQGKNPPDTERVREIADWLDERASAYKAREDKSAGDEAFILSLMEKVDAGAPYSKALREVLAGYKLVKL